MFEPNDNIPEFWPRKQKQNRLMEKRNFSMHRRNLVTFLKWSFIEYINSAKDLDEIVDDWIKQQASGKYG